MSEREEAAVNLLRSRPVPRFKVGSTKLGLILQKRLGHLWRAAQEYSVSDPHLSRFYTNSMCDLADSKGVDLPDAVRKSLCPFCCSLLLPGVTCRVRVRHTKKKKEQDAQTDDQTKPAARTRRKRPAKRTDLVHTCFTCAHRWKPEGKFTDQKTFQQQKRKHLKQMKKVSKGMMSTEQKAALSEQITDSLFELQMNATNQQNASNIQTPKRARDVIPNSAGTVNLDLLTTGKKKRKRQLKEQVEKSKVHTPEAAKRFSFGGASSSPKSPGLSLLGSFLSKTTKK